MDHKMPRQSRPRRLLVFILVFSLALPMGFSGIVGAQSAVAETGGVLYETLDQAVAAAQDGGTIRLLGDLAIDGSIETGILDRPDTRMILDLNGHTITGEREGPLLRCISGTWILHNGTLQNSMPGGQCVLAPSEQEGTVSAPVGAATPDWEAAALTLVPGYPVTVQLGGPGQVFYEDGNNQPLTDGESIFLAGGGTRHTFRFQSETGFMVKQLLRNEVALAPTETLVIDDFTEATQLVVTFDVQTFLLSPQVFAEDKQTPIGAVVTPGASIVEYGEDAHFEFIVNEGFKLTDVVVDGVSLGPVTSIDVLDVKEIRDIRIILEKTAFFIMLDAGHFANYNHSPVVSAYYAGNEMWTFHLYLKQELEKYPDVIVKTTRADNSQALGLAMAPSDRGAAGAGCDLVLSLHSNATSQESVNHAVGIYTLDPALSEVSKGLGDALTTTVTRIMGLTQAPKVYTRAQSDGRDWYGINRGASAVGVPNLILEHSFHTNTKATIWLLNDWNKRTMAVAEAQTIAGYFGIGQGGVITNPGTPGGFVADGYGYDSNLVSWQMSAGATGYEIYRADSLNGPFTLIKTTTDPYFLDTGLTCGRDYYYIMRACKLSVEGTKYSSFTVVDSARPLPAKPTARVVAGNNRVTVKWSKVAGASGYMIFRASGNTGSFIRVKTISNSNVLYWTNTNLRHKAVYRYIVRAYRVSGGQTWYSIQGGSVQTRTL